MHRGRRSHRQAAGTSRRERDVAFILDENMVQGEPHRECVGCLLMGRGHRVEVVQGTSLEGADDFTLCRYAGASGLVVVTFNRDLLVAAKEEACRCLIIKPPEWTARFRLSEHYAQIIDMVGVGAPYISLPATGDPYSLS